jgi:metal-responsive CopG/Arc/MetJ family transcriptional regulator
VKKVGRPRTDTEGVMVKLPREMIDRLDDVRRKQKDIPTRPEMIRRMIQEWFVKNGKPEG